MKKRKTPARKLEAARRVTRKKAFIAAYTTTASVQKAAEAAKVHKSRHYRWLEEDPEYAEEFRKAQDEAAQMLEDEAVRRAHDGVEEPVIYQGELCYEREDVIDPDTGEVIGSKRENPLVIRKFSDTLLQFLLKAFRPAKYKDRGAIEHSGPAGAPIQIDTRLQKLTDEELKTLEDLHRKLTDDASGDPGRADTPQPEQD